MGFGKIKNAWPVWTLVIAGVVVIALALSQNKTEKEAITFQDIFPTERSNHVQSGFAEVERNAPNIDPVRSPAIVASPADNSQHISYAVQLYSFKEEFRADTVVTKLKGDGIPAYVQISDLGPKGTWYRVRVGSYTTPDEAKAMLAELSKEHKDSIIVKDKK